MLKKRIFLLSGLLAVCIIGQVLLRPAIGMDQATIGSMEAAEPSDSPSETKDAPLGSAPADDADLLQTTLLRQFFYMLGFVALIGVGAWFVCKKFAGGWQHPGGRMIRVGETVRMGPRKAVHLISVGAKTYLVGSGSDSFQFLAEVTDSLDEVKDAKDV